VQALQPDRPNREEFALEMVKKIRSDITLDFPFNDEPTYYLLGMTNRHNSRICGFEKALVDREYKRGCIKLNGRSLNILLATGNAHTETI
jgi:hypothetical protein